MPRKTLEQAHLKLGKELGHGSFGTVFLCTDKDGDTKCVKKMDKSKMQGAGLEELAEEFEMMHEMSNNHIAKTFELFQDSVAYYIVNEPYYGGDLSKIRHKCEKHGVKLTDEYWKEVFKQCFEGLAYLHERGMMHCDIKEENVMLKTEDYHHPKCVLIDFGLAQHDADEKQQICGTPGYIPPETWQIQKWYPRGDIFSMGVTMLQLVIDQIPEVKEFDPPRPGMPAPPPQQVKNGIFSGGSIDQVKMTTSTMQPPLHRIPAYMSPAFKTLMNKCLQKQRKGRPTAEQAVKDAWFTGISTGLTSPREYVAQPTTYAQPTKIVQAGAYRTPVATGSILSTPVPLSGSFKSSPYRTTPTTYTSPTTYTAPTALSGGISVSGGISGLNGRLSARGVRMG
jgi:serine/threonine protein kinase